MGHQDSSSKTERSDPSAQQDTIDGGTVEDLTPISIDVVAALFPATAADASNMTRLSGLFGRVFDVYFVECMNSAGFELELPIGEPSGRHYDFPDLEDIAVNGFGVMHSLQAPNQWLDPLQALPLELHTQYAIDQTACYETYVEEFGDPMGEILEAANILQDQWYGEIATIDSSPEMIAEYHDWRECMTEGGRTVDSHRGFFADLDGILLELSDDFSAALAEELSAAELYVACMAPLEEVRQPIRDKARQEFLEDNAEEVRAIQELANRLILEVQQS